MIRLSPCAEIIFTHLKFPERIDEFARLGFKAFEFWGWRNKNIDEILRKKEEKNLEISAMCVDPQPPIVDHNKKGEFIEALENSILIAKKLGVKNLIITTGNELESIPREVQHESIVECLKEAAPILEENRITGVLEPLNILVNHKGYYLSTSLEGFEIIRKVGSENVKLLYDIYHQQITEGNLIQNITENISLIGHFHSADVPGRHELGTGEINYRKVVEAIKKTGYSRYFGLEFIPLGSSEEALISVKKILEGLCE